MTAGECKKHPGTQRIEMVNARGGKYFGCPTCKSEKAGGGLPPIPPAKSAAKKAAKKTAPKPPTPPVPPRTKNKSTVARFLGGFGLG